MAALKYKNLISFVPEKPRSSENYTRKELLISSELTGDEAKSFYENLISEKNEGRAELDSMKSSDTPTNKCSRRNRKLLSCKEEEEERKHEKLGTAAGSDVSDSSSRPHVNCEDSDVNDTAYRQGLNLLKCAEHGELRDLKRWILRGVPVDFKDTYGWTALMCASVAGQVRIVDHLIESGATVTLVNKQNKTALELARQAGMKHIVTALQCSDRCDKSKTKKGKMKSKKFYCKVCDREFTDLTEVAHQSSTVHLFNMKLEPKPDPFLIPPTNVGFKLMRKSGWDGEKGLGPEGTGLKYPVKTVLKRDRACLGSDTDVNKRKKAKVTHFGPNDTDSIKSVPKCTKREESARVLSKRARKRKEQRDKEWERSLRQYMNTD